MRTTQSCAIAYQPMQTQRTDWVNEPQEATMSTSGNHVTSRQGHAVSGEPRAYGRHAREPAGTTTLLPLPQSLAAYGIRVRVNGRYVALTFPRVRSSKRPGKPLPPSHCKDSKKTI